MTGLKKFAIGLLISLFVIPFQVFPQNYSYAEELPPAKDTPATQIILPPSSGKIELTDKRTTNSKVFLKSDGKKEMVVYQSPVHFQDSKARWQEINTSLQDSRMQINPIAPKEYENKANNFRVSLSENLAQKAFSLQKNQSEIDLKLSDIRSTSGKDLSINKTNLATIKPERNQNRLTYKNIYKDTDLIYYSMASGLKEDIILNSYSGQNQFVFDLNIENADYERKTDGSYVFYKSGTKEIQFRMPAFYMWDNKGGKDSESNQYSYNVKSEIINNEGELSVVLTADDSWLSSSERVFPITIDPSFITNDIEDTYIQTGYPDTLAWDQRALYVGQGSTKGLMRALVLFNVPVPDLYGARIFSSRFEVLQYANCYGTCTWAGVRGYTTSNFNPWDTTWNHRPVELGRIGDAFNNSTWDWFVMDVTPAAAHWIYGNNDGSVPGGLEFVQEYEDQWGYRTWAAQNHPDYSWGQPRLIIEYNDYNAQYQVTDVPEMIAGTSVEVPVTVANTGRNTWTKGQFKLSYHWVNNATAEMAYFEGIRTELPRDVPKGDAIALLAKVRAPSMSGDWKLQWDMVHEGATWFSHQGVATADRGVNIVPPSFSSMTHLGTEGYYAKAGPVDLATGNLSFSTSDMSINSASSGLNVIRSYNSATLDQTFVTPSDGYIKSWIVNGPYKENNQSVRLTRPYIASEEKTSPSLGSTSNRNLWTKYESPDYFVDLNHSFNQAGSYGYGAATNVAAYANIYVYSATEQNIQLRTGSDDGIRIWLNKNLIRSNDVYRGLSGDSDIDNVTLKAGWNSLLLKISQGAYGWAYSARFTNYDGSPITDLKYSLYNPEVFQATRIAPSGWSFNFDELLNFSNPENVYYRDGTGTVNIFNRKSDGSYDQPAGSDFVLKNNTDGSYYLESKNGTKKNFDSSGKIINVIDLVGNKLEYQYDSTGKCIKMVDGTRFITLQYSGDWIRDVSDALGNRILYFYDLGVNGNPGKLSRVIDPLEKAFGYEYNNDGKIIKYFDKKWNATSISYSGNKVSSITDALNNTTSFSYLDKSTEINDALGRKSIARFNESNLLTAFTNANNYTELYQHDGMYHTTSVTPAIPENEYYFYRWSYIYDTNGNLIEAKDPTDAVTKYTYNGNDLIQIIEPKGTTTSYSYSSDGKRLLLTSTDATNNRTTYTYDTKGRVISATDPKGAITKYTYTANGDVATLTSPKNEITRFGYDVLGRKILETSPMGYFSKYYYNKLSQLYVVADSMNLRITYYYDANGNKIRENNPNATKQLFAYDKLNRLITSTDETGASISYSYDKVGNKISMKDANGKETRYLYNELNQITQQIDPTGKSINLEYDRNGNVVKAVDQKGSSVTNTYDKAGDLISTESSTGVKSNITLDANKNITKVENSNGQNAVVTYNSNGVSTRIATSKLGTETAVLDKNSQAVSYTAPTATVSLTRDISGNVVNIANKLTKTATNLGTTTFDSDVDGKLKVTTKPNGDTSSLFYDSSGRITRIENKNSAGVLQKSYSYQYDLSSNQTSVLDITANKTQSFAYNARNELIGENDKTYTYDAMGNRKSVTQGASVTKYEYDTAGDANRLKKASYADGRVVTYDYDDNGNMIKENDSKKGITTYQYDSDNNFILGVMPDKSYVRYYYDQTTKQRYQRTVKNVDGSVNTTKFTYSGDRLVSETDASGNVLKNYTWDEQENLIAFTIPVGGVMTTYYYVKNAKGDVVGLSDSSGKMVVYYEYDAWGNIKIARNLTTSGVPSDLYLQNPRLYGSYWYDVNLGLYFMKTRMYDAEIGRFLSKDQVFGGGGSALDFNPYLYCRNNPVDRLDSDGKLSWSSITKFASKVVQVVKNVARTVVSAVKTVVNAVKTVNNKISNFVNKHIVYPIALGPVGEFAEWASANPYRLAGVSIAIGVACVGGYIAVQAAVAYVAGLGTYTAATASTGAVAGGGVGYKTIDVAKSYASNPTTSTQVHHIVERCQIGRSGFSPGVINGASNLIRIPTSIHKEISRLYSSIQPYSNGMTVRNWMNGQSFEQQYNFGIQILSNFGIIK